MEAVSVEFRQIGITKDEVKFPESLLLGTTINPSQTKTPADARRSHID